MIIEELISRLGFEVDGLNKLRAARKEFDRTKKSAQSTSKVLVATNRSTAVAATGVSRLGTALRTILGVFARLITVAAGVAAGVAVVGTAFVIAGVRAARARREFTLAAKEIGTTGQNLETVGNILRVAGFGDGFEDEAKKVVGAVDEISKAVRKGGDDAVEAKKKFQGFGIDKAFDVDPKTGKSRDSAAIALDIFQAYKRATEQAANLRREADAIASKAPRKASALRKKAIEQDRKSSQLAEDGGISGRLKVLLDSIALKDLPALVERAARLFPTTSNKSEGQKDDVAKQAEDAALKASALLKGTADRLTDIGVALATHVLPPLNSFLDKLIEFGKFTGLIPENVGEKAARETRQRLDAMAAGRRAERETYDAKPQDIRNKTQRELVEQQDAEYRKRYGTPTTAPLPPERPRPLPARDKDTSPAKQPQRTPTTAIRETQADLPAKLDGLREEMRRSRETAVKPAEAKPDAGWLDYFRKMLSPEVNAAKLQKTAEQKTVNQTDFGNDQRNITINSTVNGAPQEGLAAAVSGAVNQAVSRIKASNASTAGAGVP